MDSTRVLPRLAASALALAAAGAAQAELYGRVDLGYSASTSADIQDNNFPLDGVICGDAACSTPGKITDVGNAFLIGGGVGWRFNPNFRIDGTVAYRGGYKIDASVPDGLGGANAINSDVTSWNLMLNGYYDFTVTWGKPYVGAGIGWASNKVDDVVVTNAAFPGIALSAPGGSKSGFAWALMGGVGVPLSPTLTLDLGVRYTDLGKLETPAGPVLVNGTPTGFTYSGASGHVRAWELLVGLRF
jgi:opacity protein-like surface antigen